MSAFRRILRAGYLALFLTAAAAPLHASETSSCYRDVIEDCAEAMDGARWYEKFALGVFCTGMLVGCAISNVL